MYLLTLNQYVSNEHKYNIHITKEDIENNSVFFNWHNVYFYDGIILCKWCGDLYSVTIAFGQLLYVCVVYR